MLVLAARIASFVSLAKLSALRASRDSRSPLEPSSLCLGWLRVFIVALAALLAPTAQAQCLVAYEASLGSTPTSQCWQYTSSGAAPTPQMVGGRLHIGPVPPSGSSYFWRQDLALDLTGSFVLESRVQVAQSECALNTNSSWPRYGMIFGVTDTFGRFVYAQLCETRVVLANHPYIAENGVTVKSIAYPVAGQSVDVRLESVAGQLRLSINGVLQLTVPVGGVVFSGGAPQIYFGDGTEWGGISEHYVTHVRATTGCLPPSNYCTAGTTSNGCSASMSASGTPSVSATSGFTLACSNVEGQRAGLLIYGLSGPLATVWASGSSSYLCVKSPVQRMLSANSGGVAGACNGSFSLDFLGYLASNPGALGQPFLPGVCVHAQAWFRDPPAPGTTNLSDGVRFIAQP